MAAASRRTLSARAPVVLVFGEHTNDSRAVARLIEALCPGLKGRVKARSTPPSLQRSASPRAVHAWADRIADVVQANTQPVACVFVHRDSDAPDRQAASSPRRKLHFGQRAWPMHMRSCLSGNRVVVDALPCRRRASAQFMARPA